MKCSTTKTAYTKHRVIIASVILFAAVVLIFILARNKNRYSGKMDYSWTDNSPYIAHALGGIDNCAYTNSREALEKSYGEGYRNIEADIEYTSDGELVLIHNWKKKTVKELLGIDAADDEALSLEEFLSGKICGKYTPMTFKELCGFMAEHEDMYLILDGKYEEEAEIKRQYTDIVRTATETDAGILDRMIPQIYNEEMFDSIMGVYDWKSVIFTWYRLNDEELDPEEIFSFCSEKGIRVCTMEDDKENPLIDKTAENYGVMIFVHTINDEEVRDRLFKSGVKGIYTDFLGPD